MTSKLTLKGFGPLRIGTPLSQVKSVIGLAKDQDFSTPTCSVLELAGIPHGLSIMVTNGQVSRLDITSREYATLRGARVGMAEEQLKRLYPNELTMGYDKYNQSGRYFTFVPKDVVDQNFRMVFVTDGKQVTSFRTGKLPEIEYVEGCL